MSQALPARGEIRWAAVPYAFEAPFRGPGWDGDAVFADVVAHARASRGAPLEAVVPLKVRPVLVLHGWRDSARGAYAVLRTKRLEALEPAHRELVREGRDPGLVHLAEPYAGRERAVMLRGIARLHASALDTEALGVVSPAELRVIGEGVAAAFDLDLDGLVERRVRAVLGLA